MICIHCDTKDNTLSANHETAPFWKKVACWLRKSSKAWRPKIIRSPLPPPPDPRGGSAPLAPSPRRLIGAPCMSARPDASRGTASTFSPSQGIIRFLNLPLVTPSWVEPSLNRAIRRTPCLLMGSIGRQSPERQALDGGRWRRSCGAGATPSLLPPIMISLVDPAQQLVSIQHLGRRGEWRRGGEGWRGGRAGGGWGQIGPLLSSWPRTHRQRGGSRKEGPERRA